MKHLAARRRLATRLLFVALSGLALSVSAPLGAQQTGELVVNDTKGKEHRLQEWDFKWTSRHGPDVGVPTVDFRFTEKGLDHQIPLAKVKSISSTHPNEEALVARWRDARISLIDGTVLIAQLQYGGFHVSGKKNLGELGRGEYRASQSDLTQVTFPETKATSAAPGILWPSKKTTPMRGKLVSGDTSLAISRIAVVENSWWAECPFHKHYCSCSSMKTHHKTDFLEDLPIRKDGADTKLPLAKIRRIVFEKRTVVSGSEVIPVVITLASGTEIACHIPRDTGFITQDKLGWLYFSEDMWGNPLSRMDVEEWPATGSSVP